MTVILGIDPGTNITGYGIIKLEESKPTYLHHEILKTGLKNMYTVKLSLIYDNCLLYTSPSPRDRTRSRMPSSA